MICSVNVYQSALWSANVVVCSLGAAVGRGIYPFWAHYASLPSPPRPHADFDALVDWLRKSGGWLAGDIWLKSAGLHHKKRG